MAVNTLTHTPSAPNCGTNAKSSSTMPTASKAAASLMTIFSTSVALDRPSAETLSPSSRRSRKPIRRRAASAKKLVRVTRPRPPTWMITCPNSENWLHVSRTTRPVTQVALVAVNMASMTPSRPVLLEMGRASNSVPTAMTSRKLMQMVCVALLPASQPLLGRRVRFLVLFFPIATSRGSPGQQPEGRVVLPPLRKVSRRRSLSL